MVIFFLIDFYVWDLGEPGCCITHYCNAASCPAACSPVFPNIPLLDDSRTHLKIIILIISLDHWLLPLSLLSSLQSLYFQIPSAWEITFLIWKLASDFCAAFTKFLPSVIFMNPFAERIPSSCLSILNKTPINKRSLS